MAAALVQAACFAPELPDGVIACGEAGCPSGMSCALDGFCYSDDPGGGGDGTHIALAVANNGAPNRLYAYCDDTLQLVWSDDQVRTSRAVAWGDFDGDGILELAAGDEQDGVLLHRFTAGTFGVDQNTWMDAPTRDLAWGDVDEDGEDDLAVVADGARVQLLEQNRDGELETWWSSEQYVSAFAVAASDMNGDGRTDFAVGAQGAGVIVYESHGDGMHPEWAAELAETTEGVAWADADGDGDPDLVVANQGQPLRVYANRGQWFEEIWASSEILMAESVAWGDVDGDGDPDLAVGTEEGSPELVFRNDGDSYPLIWESQSRHDAEAVAWIDLDRDGDMDLAVGNDGHGVDLYLNEDGELSPSWSSGQNDPVWDVEWATWSGGPDPCRLP